MNENEIRCKLKELKESGRTRIVIKRICNKPDVKGAIEIIKNNPEISGFWIVSLSPFNFITQNEEQFLTTDDLEYNKIGREALLKMFCSGK